MPACTAEPQWHVAIGVMVRVKVMVMVRVRVRFAFCRLGFSLTFSLTEYIHAAFFTMWYVCDRVDDIFDLVPLDESLPWSLCWSSRKAAG